MDYDRGPSSSRFRRVTTGPSGPTAPPSPAVFHSEVGLVIRGYLSDPNTTAVLSAFTAASGITAVQLDPSHIAALSSHVERVLGVFGVSGQRRAECLQRLRALGSHAPSGREGPLMVPIEREADIVHARSLGQDICRSLGFTMLSQTKVATAISELARNIFQYAGRGRVELRPMNGDPPGIEIKALDEGPGILDLKRVMSPTYRSRSGLGAGLRGTRRLMDHFEVISRPGKGTTVTIRKFKE